MNSFPGKQTMQIANENPSEARAHPYGQWQLAPDGSGRVQLTIDLSPDLNATIERLALETESTKADVLRRGIALYMLAVDARKEGLRIGLAKEGQELETEIDLGGP